MQKKSIGGGGVLAGFYKVVWECLTSKGMFERRPLLKHPSPWPTRSSVTTWLGSDLSPLVSASPLCFRHTGLLAVLQTCQARSYLRTFSLSVPSARKPLPSDLRVARVLTSFRSLLQCPLLRKALPNHLPS